MAEKTQKFEEWVNTPEIRNTGLHIPSAYAAWNAAVAEREERIRTLDQIVSQQNEERAKIIDEARRNDANRATIELAATERARQAEERIRTLETQVNQPDVDVCWEHAPHQTDKSIRCGLSVGHDGQHCYSRSTVTFFWPNLQARIERVKGLVEKYQNLGNRAWKLTGVKKTYQDIADELLAALDGEAEERENVT